MPSGSDGETDFLVLHPAVLQGAAAPRLTGEPLWIRAAAAAPAIWASSAEAKTTQVTPSAVPDPAAPPSGFTGEGANKIFTL